MGSGFILLICQLSVHEMSPTPGLVLILITACWAVYLFVWEFLTGYGFLHLFFYVSTTFSTDPRVVGSVVESASLKHPHWVGNFYLKSLKNNYYGTPKICENIQTWHILRGQMAIAYLFQWLCRSVNINEKMHFLNNINKCNIKLKTYH